MKRKGLLFFFLNTQNGIFFNTQNGLNYTAILAVLARSYPELVNIGKFKQLSRV